MNDQYDHRTVQRFITFGFSLLNMIGHWLVACWYREWFYKHRFLHSVFIKSTPFIRNLAENLGKIWKLPPTKINKLKIFWNKLNCAPAKWALEKESRREGECPTLPLILFQKQWSYLFSTVVFWIAGIAKESLVFHSIPTEVQQQCGVFSSGTL